MPQVQVQVQVQVLGTAWHPPKVDTPDPRPYHEALVGAPASHLVVLPFLPETRTHFASEVEAAGTLGLAADMPGK